MSDINIKIKLDIGWLLTTPQIGYQEGELLGLENLEDTNDEPIAEISFRNYVSFVPGTGTVLRKFNSYEDELIISGGTITDNGNISLPYEEVNKWYYSYKIKNPLNGEYVNLGYNDDRFVNLSDDRFLVDNNSYYMVEVLDDDTDEPIEGVTINYQNDDIVKTTTTRSDGFGLISNIPIGNCNLLFSKTGYVAQTISDHVILSHNAVVLDEIKLVDEK